MNMAENPAIKAREFPMTARRTIRWSWEASRSVRLVPVMSER